VSCQRSLQTSGALAQGATLRSHRESTRSGDTCRGPLDLFTSQLPYSGLTAIGMIALRSTCEPKGLLDSKRTACATSAVLGTSCAIGMMALCASRGNEGLTRLTANCMCLNEKIWKSIKSQCEDEVCTPRKERGEPMANHRWCRCDVIWSALP